MKITANWFRNMLANLLQTANFGWIWIYRYVSGEKEETRYVTEFSYWLPFPYYDNTSACILHWKWLSEIISLSGGTIGIRRSRDFSLDGVVVTLVFMDLMLVTLPSCLLQLMALRFSLQRFWYWWEMLSTSYTPKFCIKNYWGSS